MSFFGRAYFGLSYFGVYFGPDGDGVIVVPGDGRTSHVFSVPYAPAVYTLPGYRSMTTTNVAPEVLVIHPDETRTVSVVFSRKLASGDTITGTPVIEQQSGTGTLTFGDPTVNASAAVVGRDYRAASSVVEFQVTGGTTGITYEATVTAETTLGETLVGVIRILVDDETV